MEIDFVEYTDIFLNLSWSWLNNPEIKELTNTPTFTKEDQKRWFDDLKNKNDYLIFGITYNDIPIGVCGLKNINKNDCEYWGYIGEKMYWGKGIGKIILKQMEKMARELGIKTIYLNVIKTNDRAIFLYTRSGYSITSESDKTLTMNKKL
jgi:RimJ/RimL family protein N-acetyltransferase